MKYLLVIKKGNNYRIGKNEYKREEALTRKNELKSLGINVEVMSFDEAYGVC